MCIYDERGEEICHRNLCEEPPVRMVLDVNRAAKK